jgi:hypothetical protein
LSIGSWALDAVHGNNWQLYDARSVAAYLYLAAMVAFVVFVTLFMSERIQRDAETKSLHVRQLSSCNW